jgi:microcystin-dependent protein
MAEPFLSEIRIMSFSFAPKGWAMCNGQLLPINQNQGLFSLLGTTYGGDGRVNFALPNLQARVPLHTGNGHVLGERAGESAHTVSIAEMPLHDHAWNANSSNTPTNTPTTALVLAKSTGDNAWGPASNLTAMDPSTITNIGGSQSHLNMQPYLALTFCIALQGIFPSQT